MEVHCLSHARLDQRQQLRVSSVNPALPGQSHAKNYDPQILVNVRHVGFPVQVRWLHLHPQIGLVARQSARPLIRVASGDLLSQFALMALKTVARQ